MQELQVPKVVKASVMGSTGMRRDWFGWLQTAFAGHFVLAQLAPQDINDYDDILAQLLQGTSLADARIAASLAEGLSTSLLQNRYMLMPTTSFMQHHGPHQIFLLFARGLSSISKPY